MNKQQIQQLQDSLVSHGYMTQAEVNTGYGIYGPKTTAAFSKYQADTDKAIASHPVLGGNINNPVSQAARDAASTQSETGQPYSPEDYAVAVEKSKAADAEYYKQEQEKATQDTAAALAGKQAGYEDFLAKSGADFQGEKAKQDEAAAQQGVLFSGGRAQKLANLQSSYSQEQASKFGSLQRDIGKTARDYQYEYGNEAAGKQPLSQYYNAGQNVYNAGVAGPAGVSRSGLSSVYSPSESTFGGRKVAEQSAMAQKGAGLLLKNRTNKLSQFGYKNQF